MMNNVCLSGRLTADPELRHTKSDKAVTQFTLAVDRNYVGADHEKKCDFITIVAWNNTAEAITKYLKKGNLIGIVGELQTRTYSDKDGNKRTAVEVIASSFYFYEKRNGNETSSGQKTNGSQNSPSAATGNNSDFVEIGDDDDLPF